MTSNAKNGLALAKKCWQNHLQIKPIKIVVLNLMPTKLITELQFLNNFNNLPVDVEMTFLYPKTHHFKGIDKEVIYKNYADFAQIKSQVFDGLIITGAPIEKISFDEVDYWQEFNQILAWAKSHVKETLLECWAAQAGLYTDFKIKKQLLNKKLFGVFTANQIEHSSRLTRNFRTQSLLKMPQSRYTKSVINSDNLPANLKVILSSNEAGPMILRSHDFRSTYITGHPEYDKDTLAKEYYRDQNKGYKIATPQHYFTDQQNTKIDFSWQSSANLIFRNWVDLIAE